MASGDVWFDYPGGWGYHRWLRERYAVFLAEVANNYWNVPMAAVRKFAHYGSIYNCRMRDWKEMGENINTYYVNGKPPPPPNKDEQEVKDVVGNPFGKEGAPTTFADYESTMQKLSKESKVPIQILRALGKHESGIHVGDDGALSSYSYRGDKQLGTAGSFGMFHVRSDPKKGAAVEDYNKANNTNYTWKDTASNPIVAATIGAWYFKYWLDVANGDPYLAYMYYNGGPNGPMKPQARANAKKFRKSLQYYNVKENFVNTSSILEGISKVNI